MQEVNLIGKLSNGGVCVLEPLNVTENGTYTPSEGVDGFNRVSVDVPAVEPVIESKNITANGTYTPSAGVDGFAPVVVNVPAAEPVIESKTINANGTYTPSEGVDGFAPVVVNVPVPTLTTLEATANGTYNAPSGTAYNVVDVDVAPPNYITMGNMFNTWLQSDMSLTFYGNKFDTAWNGGTTLGCQLYSNFDISDYSLITLSAYVTDVHYYNPSLSDVYKLTLGVSSTKPTDYSNVNIIGTPLYISDDNQWIYYTYAIPNQTCYLYINAGGWNIREVEIKLT